MERIGWKEFGGAHKSNDLLVSHNPNFNPNLNPNFNPNLSRLVETGALPAGVPQQFKEFGETVLLLSSLAPLRHFNQKGIKQHHC